MSIATLHAIEPATADTPVECSADALAQEAARYAVLRRLGGAIRHQIAGSLQPVSMMASMVERRAQKESPDLEVLRRNCAEMSLLSRTASSECVALVGWLAPPHDEPTELGSGVEECLHLLATEMSLRGFTLVNEVGSMSVLVARPALRNLLPALLMALTDASERHAEVRVQAQRDQDEVWLDLTLTPSQGDEAPGRAKAYRPIGWADVRALAVAEHVDVKRTSEGARISLAAQQRKPAAGAGDLRWG